MNAQEVIIADPQRSRGCNPDPGPQDFEAMQPCTPSDSHNTDAALAYGLFRLVLGVNLAMHGVVRIGKGVQAFALQLAAGFAETPLPTAAVELFGQILPWLELTLGLLLILGLFTRQALAAALLLMAALTVGMCLRQQWDIVADQLIYAAAFAALLATRSHNHRSLDHRLPLLQKPSNRS